MWRKLALSNETARIMSIASARAASAAKRRGNHRLVWREAGERNGEAKSLPVACGVAVGGVKIR